VTHRQIAWAFVGAQFVLLLAIILIPQGDDWTVTLLVDILAVLFGLVGLGLGLWAVLYLGRGLSALPLPNGEVDVVSTGPYRLVRHPMYVAVMAFVIALTLRSGRWVVVILSIALGALFTLKTWWEEARLEEAMPEYAVYRAVTPRFIPSLRRRA